MPAILASMQSTTTTSVTDVSQPNNPFARGIVLMIACLGFFTANALLIKYLGTYHHTGTWSLVFLRGLVGLLIVVIFYGKRSGLSLSRIFTQPMLVTRGLLGVFGLCAYYWTIPRLGAGLATLLSNLYVVLGAVFAACFLVKEKLSSTQFIWLIVSLFGVGLLSQARSGIDFDFAVALAGAVAAGMVIVIIRFLHRTEATPTIFASQCVYAMIAVLPLAVSELLQLTGRALVWALTASFMAALGQLTMTHSFRYLNVSIGGAFHLTIPVWVSIGGFFLFGETFSLLQLAGAVLLLFGCFKAIRR